MKNYSCKWGLHTSCGSMPPARCIVCEKCGTTLRNITDNYPFNPKEEHIFIEQYDNDNGKLYLICRKCNIRKKADQPKVDELDKQILEIVKEIIMRTENQQYGGVLSNARRKIKELIERARAETEDDDCIHTCVYVKEQIKSFAQELEATPEAKYHTCKGHCQLLDAFDKLKEKYGK